MFRVLIVVALSCIGSALADTCYTPYGGTYYCSLGQSCGSYYGDCRGLSTYAIMAIVFSAITLLSICIRCCIYCNNQNNPRPGAVTTVANPRVVRVQVRPTGPNYATMRPPAPAAVHTVVETAPPTYAAAVSAKDQYQKY